jgi:hypothetical protein
MKPSAIARMGLLGFLIGCFSGKYHKKNGEWYWKDQPMRQAASNASVKQLNGDFAAAGDQAFFRAALISAADGRTFAALNDHYAKDKQSVFYCDDYRDGKEYYMIKRDRVAKIPGADAASFRLLDDYYARDAARVYFNGVPFLVNDVASFEVLSYLAGRDHTSGYYLQRPVPGSDGRTFAVVDDHYTKDDAKVFFSDSRMEDGALADVVTTQLADAKASSFVSLGNEYGTDSVHVYFKGKAMAGATLPLDILNFFYAKTATHVYYMSEPIKGADAATFKVAPTDTYTALDTSAFYKEGHKLRTSTKH